MGLLEFHSQINQTMQQEVTPHKAQVNLAVQCSNWAHKKVNLISAQKHEK